MLRRHVVVPNLPAPLQARLGRGMAPPAWVTAELAGTEHLGERLRLARIPSARRGQRFRAAIAGHLAAVPRAVDAPAVPCPADVRYPFLHRPLVELALRLPPRLHIRPAQSKWLLRQASRGLLPEEIRTRQGKGVIDARILWALQRESGRLERLLADPILAQLGCVEPGRLRAAVDAARRGVPGNTVFLMSALALETWLTVRSGRWERTAIHSATAA
jgi:asparagine synthase (glutamine-hydrolysing)